MRGFGRPGRERPREPSEEERASPERASPEREAPAQTAEPAPALQPAQAPLAPAPAQVRERPEPAQAQGPAQVQPESARARSALEREERRKRLAAIGFVEGYQPRDRRTLKPIPITERDVAVVFFLGSVHLAPVDVLADRFFAKNPQTGKPNANPQRAAIRRLDELAKAGYLHQGSIAPSPSKEPGGRVYMLGAAGAAAVGVPLTGVTAKRVHHHIQTLRAVEVVRVQLEAEGRSISGLELERGEMASQERNRGRHVPDAIVTVDDGSTVAVEYVSTDYTDRMIAEKGGYFAERYSRIQWAANSAATQRRVVRLTSADCPVIAPSPLA